MRSAEARFSGVDHQQQFHQVAVHRRAGRLDHENVRAAHVFLDLQVDLAVGELLDHGTPNLHAQRLADLLGQRGLAFPVKIFRRS